MPDLYTDQLSAYLDGELDDLRQRRLEAHLGGCAECTALLADLRAIVAAAPHYEGRSPTRDLWKDIEGRLSEPEVVELSSRPGAPAHRRTGSPSWSQLIAASLLMAALGGGGAWLALRNRIQEPAVEAVQPPHGPTATLSDSTNTVAYAEEQYDSAVRDLELLLDAGRGRLDSATVHTIELSLAKIDSAIAEA